MTKHEQRLTETVKELAEEVRLLRHEIECLKMRMPSVCIPSVLPIHPNTQPLMNWRDDEVQISPPLPKPPAVRPRY